MKPPYDISPKILKLITAISEKIGEVNANYLTKQSPASTNLKLVPTKTNYNPKKL